MGSDAGEVHASSVELDEEQDVQRLQPDRLNCEEVGGEDAASLGSQELRPGRPLTAWGRPEPVGMQDPPDGRRPDPDSDLAELALDPDVAPRRVLPGEAQDK